MLYANLKKYVFSFVLNNDTDSLALMSDGIEFHSLAEAYENARWP